MSINKLYDTARPVPESLYGKNKYTYFSQYNIVPCKYLDVNDILTNPNVQLKNFITEFEQILLFPNYVNGVLTDITIRSINGRGHLKLGSNQFPYNIGNLSESFRYGDTLYIVEGIGDLIAIKLINPNINIIAMQSSSLPKQYFEMLKSITNNFVLLHDNDEAGESGSIKMKREFAKHSLNLDSYPPLNLYNMKDAGDLLDKIIEYHKNPIPSLLQQIKVIQQYYEIILRK